MTAGPRNRYPSSAQFWSKVAAAATLAVGVLVLAGWWLNFDVLKSILPGAPVTKANSALAFALAGLALWLLQTKSVDRRLLTLRRVCAGLVTLIGLLTLVEYAFGWQLGIDQLLARDTTAFAGLFPGRAAVLTALNFVLIGLALLFLDASSRYRLAQSLALLAGLVALLAVIGYLYGAEAFYRLSAGNAMALPTAVAFLILSLGLLFVRPTEGWMATVTSDSAAGELGRRLLPAAVIVPVVLGWLRLQGQNAGLYDTRFGLALFATSNIIVFTGLIAASAGSLFRTDLARQKAENQIKRLNAELEGRVLERTSQLTLANKQLEHEAAERERAEAKFRALLEAAPDAMVIINPEGKIVLVNTQAEELFGYQRAALLGQSIEVLVPKRFHGQDFAQRASQFDGRTSNPGQGGPDLYGLRRDGSEFPVEMTISSIQTAEGILLSSAIRDITERKRAEELLRSSQARLMGMINSAMDAIISIDANENILLFNPAAEAMFGCDQATALGQPLARFLPERFRASHSEHILHFGQTGITSRAMAELGSRYGLRSSGQEFPVEASISQVETAGSNIYTVILRDITGRQEAARAVARDRDILRASIEAMGDDGLIVADLTGKFLIANQAAERILGTETTDAPPDEWADKYGTFLPDTATVCPTEDLPLVRAIHGQISRGVELLIRHAGRPAGAYISLNGSPLKDENGSVWGGVVIFRDITDRKQAEAALARQTVDLRESSERFRAFFDNSLLGILLTGTDGHILEANPEASRMLGHATDALRRIGREGIVDPSDSRLATAVGERSRTGQHKGELTLVRSDGSKFPAEIFTAAYSDGSGAEHNSVMLLDITERKRAEAALRDSEAKLRALFEVLPVGITIMDRERHIVDANPALERMLAISKGRLAEGDYTGLKYIHPDGSEIRFEDFPSVRAFATQQSILDFEMGVILETGRTVWTSVSAVPVPAAGLGAVVVTTDITERREMEAALAQERDLLQALLDNVPDTIYFKDTASRFTRINLAQARVLGVDAPRDAYGKTDADFQASSLAAEFGAEEQRIFQTGLPIIDRQEFNPTPDGRARWFSATKVPLTDRQGRVQGLIGISRDITQRIQAEEGQRQANAALTERVGQMSLLHELEEQLQVCLSVAEVYQVTAQLAGQLFPDESGALYIVDSSRHWVETGSAWGAAPPETQVFGLDDCWALRRGRTHLSGQAHPSQIACGHLKGAQPALSVCIPMLAQGETLGILHLRSAPSAAAPRFDDGLLQLTRVVADSVALAMANLNLREKLRQQSIRDPLTNLYNRRYMEESLERELLLAARRSRAVGVIMLDVDHFKQVNDLYGHSAGDAVLRQLGRYLIENTRSGDIACRYGGEEFTLILPEANLEQAQLRAEQHRQAFKAILLEHGGGLMAAITLSFGVAAFPNNGQTSEDLLRAADAALYRAKREGRDRVIVAEQADSASQAG